MEASRASGTTLPMIVIRHILPNLLGKVIVQGSITFALTVLCFNVIGDTLSEKLNPKIK